MLLCAAAGFQSFLPVRRRCVGLLPARSSTSALKSRFLLQRFISFIKCKNSVCAISPQDERQDVPPCVFLSERSQPNSICQSGDTVKGSSHLFMPNISLALHGDSRKRGEQPRALCPALPLADRGNRETSHHEHTDTKTTSLHLLLRALVPFA